MSADSFSLDTEFYGNDVPLKHPSKILFVAGLVSVLAGSFIGVYGIVSADTASNSQQYLIGTFGYLLTAIIPIILLQIILMNHASAVAHNQEEPYDNYAGEQMQNKFRKIVLIGLISAGLSIWVFFLPIAERFAA